MRGDRRGPGDLDLDLDLDLDRQQRGQPVAERGQLGSDDPAERGANVPVDSADAVVVNDPVRLVRLDSGDINNGLMLTDSFLGAEGLVNITDLSVTTLLVCQFEVPGVPNIGLSCR